MSDVCVWEDFLGGQAGGGEEGRSGYSTKNKNPHVNVGKKYHYMGIFFKNSQNTIKILYKEL